MKIVLVVVALVLVLKVGYWSFGSAIVVPNQLEPFSNHYST